MKNYIQIPFVLFALSSCATTQVAENMAAIEVDYQWQKKHECSTLSPQIRLSGVPDSAVELNIKMRDLDSPNYPHGGGVVAYTGSGVIEEGALAKFKGPCPPRTHRYVIKVKAIDNSGVVVGEGKLMQKYPPD